ncbi:hypothetical protein WN944_008116 [Citrus x changshan-huyou]|uniref:Uncharacterized protein n=1 Tax=Citrus x changshan-huyou TaxID=2935761 RepID=A0AAP0MMB7_9ROSI
MDNYVLYFLLFNELMTLIMFNVCVTKLVMLVVGYLFSISLAL